MRVILPITDPYVVHHGALGSFATVYLPEGRKPQEVADRIAIEGIDVVMTSPRPASASSCRPTASAMSCVVSTRKQGPSAPRRHRHDLSGAHRAAALAWRPDRAGVPMIANRRDLRSPERPVLRNFDVFDVARQPGD
jgi:phosphonoacetate hydrolase